MAIAGVRVFLQPGVVGTCRTWTVPPTTPVIVQENVSEIGSDGFLGYQDLDAITDIISKTFGYLPPVPPSHGLNSSGYQPNGSVTYSYWSELLNEFRTAYYEDNLYGANGPPGTNLFKLNSPGAYDGTIALQLLWLKHMFGIMHPQNPPDNFSVAWTLVGGASVDILAPDAFGVDVTITDRGPNITSWYGEPDTGKMGYVTEIYDGVMYGEMHFINFKDTRILLRRS